MGTARFKYSWNWRRRLETELDVVCGLCQQGIYTSSKSPYLIPRFIRIKCSKLDKTHTQIQNNKKTRLGIQVIQVKKLQQLPY